MSAAASVTESGRTIVNLYTSCSARSEAGRVPVLAGIRAAEKHVFGDDDCLSTTEQGPVAAQNRLSTESLHLSSTIPQQFFRVPPRRARPGNAAGRRRPVGRARRPRAPTRAGPAPAPG